MTETTWLIETRDLTRVYGDGEAIYALDKVNLTIAHGPQWKRQEHTVEHPGRAG
jgi:hypothetical protein